MRAYYSREINEYTVADRVVSDPHTEKVGMDGFSRNAKSGFPLVHSHRHEVVEPEYYELFFVCR